MKIYLCPKPTQKQIDCPIAIDGQGVYFFSREARAFKVGYRYFEQFVSFNQLEHLSLYPEPAIESLWLAIGGILVGFLVTAGMIAFFAAGIYIIGLITLMGPLLIIASVIRIVTGPNPHSVYIEVRIKDKPYKLKISPKIWVACRTQVLTYIENANCPHKIRS